MGVVGITALAVPIIIMSEAPAPDHSPAIRQEPEPTIEVTCKEGVLEKLDDAIKAYDTSTYKAKREAGEKVAAAARAVTDGCSEMDQPDPEALRPDR
jgi:hypothetical protein